MWILRQYSCVHFGIDRSVLLEQWDLFSLQTSMFVCTGMIPAKSHRESCSSYDLDCQKQHDTFIRFSPVKRAAVLCIKQPSLKIAALLITIAGRAGQAQLILW